MRVLACAVGFGLGPAGKLCSVVENNKCVEWYACGDELDLSIYESNPYIDVCWSKERAVLEAFVEKYGIRYAVNVLDPDAAIILEDMGIKVLYIDSLPFMWTKADLIPYNVWAYCGQKYPNYTRNPALNEVNNFMWVDPIIPDCKIKNRGDYFVINFGGLHSPFGDGEEYFKIIMESLLHIVEQKSVYITGGKNVIRLAQELYPQFVSRTYSHKEFLELVSGAELFFTSPGLTTIYETCEMDIKTIILPPQNLSQFYNRDAAKKVCRSVKVLDWNRDTLKMSYLERFKDSPEEETVTFIYEQIKLLADDDAYRKEYKLYMQDIMKAPFMKNDGAMPGNQGVKQVSEVLHRMMEEV
ncbi:MAG: hypothetical protein IKT31_02745 [Firmicutes bacterium]|nr:hypothetical protein [Bacillota bacterium]